MPLLGRMSCSCDSEQQTSAIGDSGLPLAARNPASQTKFKPISR
jgi:hypothetical protein